MRLRSLLVALALLAVLGALAGTADAQCAMCKTVLEGSEEGRSMAGSLNKAILLMIFAPYAVAGVFAAVAFRSHWRPWLRATLQRFL
jgi:hypothetical protein